MDNPWQYSTFHNGADKIIEGQMMCRVWLPNQDMAARMSRSASRALNAAPPPEIAADAWLGAYTKVA